jgi:hypothetical protein
LTVVSCWWEASHGHAVVAAAGERSATDPLIFGGGALFLAVVAWRCYIPALRATRTIQYGTAVRGREELGCR